MTSITENTKPTEQTSPSNETKPKKICCACPETKVGVLSFHAFLNLMWIRNEEINVLLRKVYFA